MDKPTEILLDYNLIPHRMEITAHAKLWDSDTSVSGNQV